MKLKNYMLILLLIIANRLYSQPFVKFGEMGMFNNACSISINQAGFIFVTDVSTNEVFKLDTLGNVIKSIGGYGWTKSLFDSPIDVFSTTLNVYISDKNNHRIEFFDKDLNYLSEFSKQNSADERVRFRYPLCSAVSSQGDLFVLDSDNNRILKFNLNGDFIASIGGFDAGQYALNNPKHFVITSSGKIAVVDNKYLVIFDQFGNGIKKIPLQFECENLNLYNKTICAIEKKQIQFFNEVYFDSGITEPTLFISDLEDEIVDAVLRNTKLYILIKGKILIYKIAENK